VYGRLSQCEQYSSLVDRQSLHRVLADPSRYAVYDELARSETSMSVGELAQRLDLHPNTVRLHLEKLREAGLVEGAADRHGLVGRPHHVWSTRYTSPSLGLEPSGSRVLAHLLADMAAQEPDGPARAAEIGRRRGRELSGSHAADERPCLRALTEELSTMGFDPIVEIHDGGASAAIAFRRCPFRELAAVYPDLVCQLHRGLTEGMLSELSGGQDCRVEGFSTLVDADPCRAEVSISG
jgi:predicted ArsR family transcriptional regulator